MKRLVYFCAHTFPFRLLCLFLAFTSIFLSYPSPPAMADSVPVLWKNGERPMAAAVTGGAAFGHTAVISDRLVVDVFDTATPSWSEIAVPSYHVQRAFAALDNKLFVAGGYWPVDHRFFSDVYVYNRQTGSWSTNQLSLARASLTPVTVGRKVLFAGGKINEYPGSDAAALYSSVVDIYDDATDTWSSSALSQVRDGIAAAGTGHIAIFAGGSTYVSYMSTVYDTADIYNSENGTWRVGHLSEARAGIGAAAAGNTIGFAGGNKNNSWTEATDKVDLYNLVTNSWSTARLSSPRYYVAGAALGSKLFFIGGDTRWGYAPSDVVDIYDTDTGNWSVSRLPQPDYGAAASAGDYLVFVGHNSVAYFSARDGAWHSAPDYCPNDPTKESPGVCGCGVPDTDSDGDGTPDCLDRCPHDPTKSADVDSDGDGVLDCEDRCPLDPQKTAPALCGCGFADTDVNNNGVPDCFEIGVTINGAALFTNSPDVVLSLVYPPKTSQILVSNDGGFSNATAITPVSSVNWKLSQS